MELWIRSQDKECLTKVNMGVMYWEDTDKRNCIVNRDNATGYSILGAYKTKERALEVLDEIQEYINNECEVLEREQHTSMGIYIKKEQMRVYEMPKE